MAGNRKAVGSKGEGLAAEFLKRKGFRILERNYRTRAGEIDIIARKGDTLVFVEVKTDRSGQFGPPETWVTPAKQRQIAKMATWYINSKRIMGVDLRFDVIGISFKEGGREINHIEDAFWVPG
ncbi:MAG TPA: YraN family protein [Candidatus Latescibacteria bacterium]|nr:YraN family protein [Candidatus Latescibacterota bacterium]